MTRVAGPENRTCFNLIDCSKKTLFLVTALWVAGCNHDPSSVLIAELRSPPRVTSGKHIVRHGETLFSISWLYSRDYKELASANGIQEPYTIYPGQTLNLAVSQRTQPAPPVKPQNKPAREVTQKQEAVKKQTAGSALKAAPPASLSGWSWPAEGRIIAGYSVRVPVNQGIDIGGNLGDPVRAAADGEVVYAGSELSGYGRLIILKHNSSYLSAYAHNRELLVREGNSVKAGQKIAEIGSTGTTEPKLHFEIRRDGKPVDPMGYLPKR